MKCYIVGWLLFIFLALGGSLAFSPNNGNSCYELPIVVLSAVDKPFPDPTCNQRRYPAPDCLKATVRTRLEVIDNNDGDSIPLRRNCINQTRRSSGNVIYDNVRANYRGQTSLFYPKHQMNLKFAEDTALLGMQADRSFVLNGPYVDCTMLRNHLAHWLYRRTGRYSPHTRHVVLYFRDRPDASEAQYMGVYLLLEKISYGPHRVNLAKLDTKCHGNELSGGWAWQNDPLSYGAYSPNMVIDQYQNEFGMGERPILSYPDGAVLSQRMRDYFVNTTTGFLPQLYRFLWHNMTSGELEEHLDLGSFADYLLHTEMSLNVDAYRRSTYFFKDRKQPINAGPVWDLNLAYGNGARRDFRDWIFPQYTFWKRLMCHYKLTSLVIQRWKQLRAGAWSDAAIEAFIDESAAPIQRQLAQCEGDWRSNVAQCAAVSYSDCNTSYAGRIADLKHAVLNRSQWMDAHITELYKELDAGKCSGVGNLPKFNCAPNGDDGGCLQEPEKYYKAVPFPPVRLPYDGPPCGSSHGSSNGNAFSLSHQELNEQPSVDPCWQSAGIYVYPQQKGVKEKSLTRFCNGYGTCAQGPGANCSCYVGIDLEPHSCRRIDAEMNLQAEGTPLRWKWALVRGMMSSLVLVAILVLFVRLRARKQRLLRPSYPPVRYGSMNT